MIEENKLTLESDLLPYSTTNNNSCSYEYTKLKDRGYNGHPTLGSCTHLAEQSIAIAAVGDALGCLIPGANVAFCAAAIANHYHQIQVYLETKTACILSYSDAQHEYNKCLQENSDSGSDNGDDSSGSGSGSGVNPGSGGTSGGSNSGGSGTGIGGSTQYCFRTINDGSGEYEIQVPCD